MPTYIEPETVSLDLEEPKILRRMRNKLSAPVHSTQTKNAKFTMYELAFHRINALLKEIDTGNRYLDITIDSLYKELRNALNVARIKQDEWARKGGKRIPFA